MREFLACMRLKEAEMEISHVAKTGAKRANDASSFCNMSNSHDIIIIYII